jgi:hypothetical protein
MATTSGDANSMKGNDLLEPFNYIASSQKEGDTLQSLLVEAFNAWMQVPHDKLEHIKKIVFMLHNASLLVDDIEDGSKMRQGAPVAHNIYGLPSTLNCANLIYFMALEHCLKLDQNNNDNSMRATAVFIGRSSCRASSTVSLTTRRGVVELSPRPGPRDQLARECAVSERGRVPQHGQRQDWWHIETGHETDAIDQSK